MKLPPTTDIDVIMNVGGRGFLFDVRQIICYKKYRDI